MEMEHGKKGVRVEVISRETIKPSSPHQGSFKLSLLDQFSPQTYGPTLLFYKATCPISGGGRGLAVNERSHRLKSSLSETLTRFYPFSGRLKDPVTLVNNDEGIEYSEAQVFDSSLSDLLEKPDLKQLNLLLPRESSSDDLATRPLLLVQVSFFQCGGMALGTKLHHRVGDGATANTFMNDWKNSALGNGNSVEPDFSASTLFPPTFSLPPPSKRISLNLPVLTSIRTGRFVFGPSELAALQARASSPKLPRPSRFEAVSAFIVKTAVLSRSPQVKKRSNIAWTVNLRSKLQPPLPEHCFGNVLAQAVHEGEVDGEDLPSLAYHLRSGTTQICNSFNQALKGDQSAPGILDLVTNVGNFFRKRVDGTIQLYVIASLCKLQLYEADFGWGKPLWVVAGGLAMSKDLIMLADTRDGRGVEAWVCLAEEEMTRFQSNQELLNYASFNPSAFN